MCHILYRKDLQFLIPETVRKMPDYQPQQWLNRVHANIQDITRRGPLECKARFVGKSIFYTMYV